MAKFTYYRPIKYDSKTFSASLRKLKSVANNKLIGCWYLIANCRSGWEAVVKKVVKLESPNAFSLGIVENRRW